MSPRREGLFDTPACGGAHLVAGDPYCATLRTLNASARRMKCILSVSGNCFWSEVSICQWPGPFSALCPRSPQGETPGGTTHGPLLGQEKGIEKAAGLIQ